MFNQLSRKSDFDVLAQMVYLNTAAEGIPPRVVGEALQQYFSDKRMGMDGREPHFREWESAKSLAAQFLGLSADEVNFCSCTSEAYNLLAMALQVGPDDEIVINDLDFPAGATPWLQTNCPAQVRLWRARQGRLSIDDLRPLLSPRTRLLTTSLVSFYNGFRVPLEDIVYEVRKRSDALIAVDVTQAMGRIPLQLSDVDFVVSSTHKWLLSTHGGGIVGIPKASKEKWIVPAGGWLHLEDAFGPDRFEKAISKPGVAGFSVGMPNFAAVYALNAALKYLQAVDVSAIDAFCRPLMDRCYEGLSRLPIEMLTPSDRDARAGIIAFRHPDSEHIQQHLRSQQIHVMHQAGRVRIAIHGYNTTNDVETVLDQLSVALK